MDNFAADQPAGDGGIFRQRDRQRPQGVKRRAGFWIRRFAMRQHGVEHHGQADGGERTRPTAAHRVGHSHAHGRGLADFLLLQVGDEFLEVLNGHAARRAAAGDAREVGGVQAEFVHARLEPRRKIAGTGGVRGHRQAADGRLDARFVAAIGV